MQKIERTKSKKKIGDVTSFTIPTDYTDWITGERKELTDEHLQIINEALDKRGLVHMVMTGTALINQILTDEQQPFVSEKVDTIAESVRKIETLVRGLYEAAQVKSD